MILINLLPPELRRRSSGVSPVFASMVGGGVLCVLLLILYAWLQWHCIPEARNKLEADIADLTAKTALANEVRQMEKQIEDNRQRRNKFYSLLAKKVYWAHALDDFANLLNGPWLIPGFDVRCSSLEVSEAPGAGGGRGAGADDTVAFAVRWNYKLIGKERARAGDYINAFFSTIKGSKFWKTQGFTGKPEDSYAGDQPRLNTAIQRIVIEGSLIWQRVKVIKDKTLAGR
jgi:Tfp pilus assembly protein PilN